MEQIDKNLEKKTKNKKSKDKILEENDKIFEIEKTFDGIEGKIEKCHENMKSKNNVIEPKDIKTLNQLLNEVHCIIKKDIQGKQIDYLSKIFEEEKNII